MDHEVSPDLPPVRGAFPSTAPAEAQKSNIEHIMVKRQTNLSSKGHLQLIAYIK
jgi:hypothetical protein